MYRSSYSGEYPPPLFQAFLPSGTAEKTQNEFDLLEWPVPFQRATVFYP
jgi:hypothetical protein